MYLIPDADLAILDKGEGGYTRIRQPLVRDVGPMDAWVYIAKEASDDAALRPYSWYERFVVDGARLHGLPADYIALLEGIVATEDEDPERDREKRTLMCDGESVMPDLLPR